MPPDAVAAGRAPILTLVLDALDKRVRDVASTEPVLRAFAGWLHILADESAAGVRSVGHDAAQRVGASRHYRDVAVLGFVCAALGKNEPAVASALAPRFVEGLAWLRGRRFFVPNQPPGFEADAIAIIGVAAGIASVAAISTCADDRQWLAAIIGRSQGATDASGWDDSLLQGAALLLDAKAGDVTTAVSCPRTLAPDLAAALAALGVVAMTTDDELRAQAEILTPEYRSLPDDRVIVQAAALRWLLRQGAVALPGRAAVSDVVTMLIAVPHALKRWPWEDSPKTKRSGATAQRWDIQNEYHVQSLLWTILAPVFPDLQDEEYLRAVGHKHPRVDLAIPSLGLIIEVKFLRGGSQSELAAVIGAVSEDTGLYLSTPSEFTQIVPFIWDDASSVDQRETLLVGLRKLPGVTDAVVVSRPGRFVVERQPQLKS